MLAPLVGLAAPLGVLLAGQAPGWPVQRAAMYLFALRSGPGFVAASESRAEYYSPDGRPLRSLSLPTGRGAREGPIGLWRRDEVVIRTGGVLYAISGKGDHPRRRTLGPAPDAWDILILGDLTITQEEATARVMRAGKEVVVASGLSEWDMLAYDEKGGRLYVLHTLEHGPPTEVWRLFLRTYRGTSGRPETEVPVVTPSGQAARRRMDALLSDALLVDPEHLVCAMHAVGFTPAELASLPRVLPREEDPKYPTHRYGDPFVLGRIAVATGKAEALGLLPGPGPIDADPLIAPFRYRMAYERSTRTLLLLDGARVYPFRLEVR